jgi:hypothetical protein
MSNGERAKLEDTPHGRVAAHVRRWFYKNWGADRKFPPDFADLKPALNYPVGRETLIAKIQEARDCKNPQRMRHWVLRLLELDAENGYYTPVEDTL